MTASVDRAPVLGLFLRVTWMLLGPIVLFALAAVISQRPGASVVDAWYLAVAAAVVAARFVDVAKFDGTTADGEPATMAHAWSYSAKLVLGAGVGWGLAQLLRQTL